MNKTSRYIPSYSGFKSYLFDLINDYLLTWKEGGVTVTIEPGRNRSREQNDLLWAWARQISNESGETPERLVALWKYEYLAPIICPDSELDEDLYRWLQGYYEEYWDRVLAWDHHCRSSKLKVSMFSEWLTRVAAGMAESGYILKDPDKKL